MAATQFPNTLIQAVLPSHIARRQRIYLKCERNKVLEKWKKNKDTGQKWWTHWFKNTVMDGTLVRSVLFVRVVLVSKAEGGTLDLKVCRSNGKGASLRLKFWSGENLELESWTTGWGCGCFCPKTWSKCQPHLPPRLEELCSGRTSYHSGRLWTEKWRASWMTEYWEFWAREKCSEFEEMFDKVEEKNCRPQRYLVELSWARRNNWEQENPEGIMVLPSEVLHVR